MFLKLRLTTITITLLVLLPAFAQAVAISKTEAALHATNKAQNALLQIGIAALEEGDLQTALLPRLWHLGDGDSSRTPAQQKGPRPRGQTP